MSTVYQTTVTVPEGFIEKELEKILGWNLGLSAKLDNNQFSIHTKNYHLPGVTEIVELSKKHQDLVFTATTVCDMTFELADVFEISNGEIISAKQDIYFNLLIEDNKRIPPDVVEAFSTEARRYFNMVDMHLVRNHEFRSFWELYQSQCSNLVFYFETSEGLFIAKRKDRENITVDVEFLCKTKKMKSYERGFEIDLQHYLSFLLISLPHHTSSQPHWNHPVILLHLTCYLYEKKTSSQIYYHSD